MSGRIQLIALLPRQLRQVIARLMVRMLLGLGLLSDWTAEVVQGLNVVGGVGGLVYWLIGRM